MSNTLKRETRSEVIKLRCTPSEKASIQHRAELCGASTVSEYLLTLALNGNTQEYAFARRKADGPLLNAEVYLKLFEMIQALQALQISDRTPDDRTPDDRAPDDHTPDDCTANDRALVEEAIALIHEVRRDIAINRLRTSFERAVEG